MSYSVEDVMYLKKYKKQLPENTAGDKAIIQARDERMRCRLAQGLSDDEAQAMESELLDMLGYSYKFGTQRKPKVKTISYSKKAKKFLEFFSGTADLPGYQSKIIREADELRAATPQIADIDANVATGLTITSMALNGFTLMGMPFIYLLAKVRGEPVPFDTSDKVKWGISAGMLILGVVAFTVPPAGFALGLTLTSIGAAMSLYGLITYARDRSKINTTKVIPNQLRIDELAAKIKTNIEHIRNHQYDIKSELKKRKPDNAKIVDLEAKIKVLEIENEKDNEGLVNELNIRRKLRIDRSPEKTLFTVLSTSAKVALLGVTIAGIVLSANPFTAPVGAIMLTTVAAIMIVNFAATKIHQARMANLSKVSKQEIDTEHKKELGLDKISSSLITAIKLNPGRAKEKLSHPQINIEAAPAKTSIVTHAPPELEPKERIEDVLDKPKSPLAR